MSWVNTILGCYYDEAFYRERPEDIVLSVDVSLS